ncbi:sigma-70 family RNA polymerase sigma factor [Oscillatoria sp. CS-180]|nr:sigma-70 family RNA polymerase sigma factor [Oscillatoria sp. CS-180]
MQSEPVTDPTLRWSDAGDAALLEAMQEGQVEALQEVYRRYGRLVYALALRILKTPEEAEDLVQDIFVKFWQKPHYNPARGSMGTYLGVIARSRALDRVRSHDAHSRLAQRYHTDSMAMATPNVPLEKATLGEQVVRVQAALSQLSPQEQEILEIAYYEGLSQSQTAQRLDIPLGTVKTRSRQALKKLRQKLQDLI